MKKLLLLLGAVVAIPSAFAQNTTYLSATTCGTQSYAAGRPAAPTVDLTGQTCISGTISASTTAKATAAAPTYVEGTNNPLSMDLAGNLRITGSLSLSGTTSNASSGVATSGTNLPAVAYTYGFNGTTWDQLQVDASKFLKVISQTGSTTAVTQATAANLNATVVGTGTFAVQAAQSGTWTVQPGNTANSTPWLVTGSGTAGTAASGVLTVQGIASMTPVQVSQATASNLNATVNVAQINGVTVLMGNGATGTGSQRVTIASDNSAVSGFGVGATGSAVPANAVFAGLSDGTNLRGWLQAANALNSTGTGIATAQIIGQFDDVAPTTITENQFGNLRMSTNRNAYVTLRDAAGNERGLNVDANGAIAVTATNATASNLKVAATLDAETTKVIGTVRVLGNAGAIVDGVNTAATAPANGVLGLGIYNSTEPSPTTGQSVGLQLDSKGRQRMVLYDAAGNTRGANVDASNRLSVTVDAFTATNASTNVAQINGVTPLMGNGVTGTGSLRVTLASDTTSNTNPFLVNGNVTPADAAALGTTSIRTYALSGIYNGTTVDMAREVANSTNSTGAGIAASGQLGQCDDTSPTALTENSFGNARIDCNQHSQLVTMIPSATAGGTTLYTLTLANSTNATNVKASAGQVYSISGFNMSSATPVWISLYNTSGTPSCGTSIIQQFMIPGNTTGAGFVYDFATPKGFATGIGFCATTGIAGTGAVAASTYVLNIDYK